MSGTALAFRFLFRWVLPAFLICGIIFRINGVSLSYLLCLLASGLCSNAGSPGAGQLTVVSIVLALSSVSLVGQGLFQIARATDYAATKLQPCSPTERLWRQIGFNQMKLFSSAEMAQYVVPDIGIFLLVITLLVLGIYARRTQGSESGEDSEEQHGGEEDAEDDENDVPGGRQLSVSALRWRQRLSNMLYCVVLLLAGCAFPSVLSFAYVLIFLVVAIAWSAGFWRQRSGQQLMLVKHCVVLYAGLHVTLLYLYLFQFFQDGVHYRLIVARILGLNAILQTHCNRPWQLQLRVGIRWSEYVSPILILFAYWVSALSISSRRSATVVHEEEAERDSPDCPSDFQRNSGARPSASSTSQLVARRRKERSTASASSADGSGSVHEGASWRPRSLVFAASVLTDGEVISVVCAGDNGGEDTVDGPADAGTVVVIRPDADRAAQADGGAADSFLDISLTGPTAQSFYKFLMAYSYIATLIVMMVWSIAYHSWLSFALLMFACLVWVAPDAGKMSAIVSPLLVFYATCLVLLEYIYGLDLVELPQYADVGLVRHPYPFGHLLLKVFFLLVILLTMHHRILSKNATSTTDQGLQVKEPVDEALDTGDPPASSTTAAVANWEVTDAAALRIPTDSAVGGADDPSGAPEDIPLQVLSRSGGQPEETAALGESTTAEQELPDGRPTDDDEPDAMTTANFTITQEDVLAVTLAILRRYWIVVCLVVYLAVALIPDVSLVKIIYMGFFLIFLITKQFTGMPCTAFLTSLWYLAVVYSMVVVAVFYTYQFDYIASSWNSSMSEDWINDIGLEKFSKEQLFVQLLLPLFVLIVVILQIHYFYAPLPQDFQAVLNESRRERKMMREEALRRRKLERAARGGKHKISKSKVSSASRGVDSGLGMSAMPEETARTASSEAGRPSPLVRAAAVEVNESDAGSAVPEPLSSSAVAAASTRAVLAGSEGRSPAEAATAAAPEAHDAEHSHSMLAGGVLVLWRIVHWLLRLLVNVVSWFFIMLLRVLDIHIEKLILLVILLVCLDEVCGVNLFPLIFVCLITLFPGLKSLGNFVFTLWAVVSIIAKMAFQLRNAQAVPDNFNFANCTSEGGPSLLYRDDAAWIGLLNVGNFPAYVQGYLFSMCLIALQVSIHRYQKTIRVNYEDVRKELLAQLGGVAGRQREDGEPGSQSPQTAAGAEAAASGLSSGAGDGSRDSSSSDRENTIQATLQAQIKEKGITPVPKAGVVFANVTREDADKGVFLAVQYLVNNCFSLFGKEMVVVVCAIVVAVRGDIIAIIYGFMLGFLMSRARRVLTPLFAGLVGFLMLLQYISVLGAPPSVCYLRDGYPWSPTRSPLDISFANFFYLPDPMFPQNKWLIVGDFFLLLCLSIQWGVDFYARQAVQQPKQGRAASSTEEEQPSASVPDFTSSDTWLDICKNAIFQHFFWITLAIVFFAGTARNSIFCLGYLCFAFVFLWAGTSQLVETPPKDRSRSSGDVAASTEATTASNPEHTTFSPRVLFRWKVLLWYTYAVILVKTCFQIWVCVDFGYQLNCGTDDGPVACVMATLLSVVCLKPVTSSPVSDVVDPVGLTLDVVSLGFLLLQVRIFHSLYFQHVQNHLDLYARFAEDGVRLMNGLLSQRQEAQQKDEVHVLDTIRRRVEGLEADPDNFQILYGGTLVSEDLAREISDRDARAKQRRKLREEPGCDQPDGGAVHGADGGSDSESDEDQFDGPVGEDVLKETDRTTGQKIRKAIEHFFDTTIIRWFDEVSFDYLYVETRLRRLIFHEKERILRKQGGRCVETVPPQPQLAPRGTSLRVLGSSDSTPSPPSSVNGTEETPGTGQPANFFGSVLRSLSVHADKLVKTKADVPLADGDPIVRLLSNGRPVPIGERAAATERLLRSELADVVYVPVRFGWALYYAILARMDIFCYFVMILDHIVSGHILTMPLPFFVFLLGMMSKPRPSARFWSFVIVYVQIVIIIKYVFQSHLVFSNLPMSGSDKPLWPPRIFGVINQSNFSRSVAADLVVLLSLCFYRALLRFHGFWRLESEEKESDGKRSGRSGLTSAQASIEEPEPGDGGTSGVRLRRGTSTATRGDDDQSTPPLQTPTKRIRKKRKKPSLWIRIHAFLKRFYGIALDPLRGGGRKDYYTLMFIFDLLTFLITIFGWSAFAEKSASASADVTIYISQNYIPRSFLALILVSFLLLIVDRVLYLRKYIYGKFVFQIILLIAVHVWLFFILPLITERPFTDNPVAQLWYFCKCVYFAISAMQLAAGYPTRILGQFLTKDANIVTAALFLVVQAIPFLLELRELLDWACTRTVLSIMYWFKVQDIWSSVFLIKSFRHYEKSSPRKLGTPVGLLIKALVGGLGVAAIILLLWFPLVLMSLINSTSLSNPPTSVTVQVQIGGYQPLFHFTADQQFLRTISDAEIETLSSQYSSPIAQSFTTKYLAMDVTRVSIPGQSSALWSISPPTRDLMQAKLSDHTADIDLTVHWSINRAPNTGLAAEKVTHVSTFPLPANSTVRTGLANMLNSTGPQGGTTRLVRLFPTFMLAPANGVARTVTELNDSSVDVGIHLLAGGAAEWWSLSQLSPSVLPGADNTTLAVFIFSDRVAAPLFSFLAGYGVIGLYVSLVLVVGQFLRLIFKNISHRIIYEDMPNPNALHTLCHNIFMARESGHFGLEERLVGQLFLLYRSPERLVELTRAKPQTYKASPSKD